MGFSESLEKMIGLATGTNDPIAMKAVMDVQRELIEIQEENRRLRLENESFRNKEIDKQKVVWRENAYYPKDDSDHVFCSRCLDKDGSLINMLKYVELYSENYSANCPECKTEIITDIKHGQNTKINF